MVQNVVYSYSCDTDNKTLFQSTNGMASLYSAVIIRTVRLATSLSFKLASNLFRPLWQKLCCLLNHSQILFPLLVIFYSSTSLDQPICKGNICGMLRQRVDLSDRINQISIILVWIIQTLHKICLTSKKYVFKVFVETRAPQSGAKARLFHMSTLWA